MAYLYLAGRSQAAAVGGGWAGSVTFLAASRFVPPSINTFTVSLYKVHFTTQLLPLTSAAGGSREAGEARGGGD